MTFSFDNITVAPARMDELAALEAMALQQQAYFQKQDKDIKMVSAYTCLTEGSLPPGGAKENYALLSVYENGTLCGNIEYYLGYPAPHTAYIGLLYLSPAVRGHGVGAQLATALCAQFAALGYTAVRLGVSVRNPAGLAFWPQQGFTAITKVSTQGTYVCLELEKTM